MMIGRVEGAQRVLGKAQGYWGLPVRDGVLEPGELPQMLHIMGHNSVDGDVPTMLTVWHPTPDELAALNAGAGVFVSLVGVAHPPIMVYTGEAPE